MERSVIGTAIGKGTADPGLRAGRPALHPGYSGPTYGAACALAAAMSASLRSVITLTLRVR